MKAAIESAVVRRWYGPGPGVLWLLWPLEMLFRLVGAVRRTLYRRGLLASSRVPVPVVVIGNIVAGGAGKTPLTVALVRALRDSGFRPGVVSRGYGRDTRETLRVTDQSTASEVGDEPLLIARETGVPVAVSSRRAEAAQELVTLGCDVVIADDGLQHYALGRDVEIAVIPGARGNGNGHLLPLGPLREPVSRLASCDFRVVMNPQEALPSGAVAVHGRAGDLIAHVDGRRVELRALGGREVLAVAAIAHPEGFFASLRAAGLRVTERRFADHHVFTPADLQRPKDMPIILTTKDAVKCPLVGEAEVYALEYTVDLPRPFVQAVESRLRRPGGAGHAASDPAATL